MKLSILVRRLLASLYSCLGGISRNLRRRSKNDFVLLMYHRTLPNTEAENCVQAGMYLKPETFEMHIRFLKTYFQITHFNKLPFGHSANNKLSSDKPLCVLTFDDGWKDFYDFAFPILKTYRAPATVFLPTDFIGTDRWFWTDRLSHLLKQGTIPLSSNTLHLNSSIVSVINNLESLTGLFEWRLERAVEMLKPYPDKEIESIISNLSMRWGGRT